MSRLSAVAVAALAVLLTFGLAVPSSAAPAADSKRVVVYYQTQYDNGTYVSPLGLTQNNTGVTDVVVAAVHLNSDGTIHLNDDPPDAATFDQMWTDLHTMQSQGVSVEAMVGGAAAGSFQLLDTQFDTYYPLLKNFLTTYGLNGVDLDVEESMSQAGIEKLIDSLYADFGPSFKITLAPVGSALSGGGNLSGFSYDQLYQDKGNEIAWFNAQLYNGWGELNDTGSYDSIINHGVVPANKVVAGTVTTSANGSGYVDIGTLQSTIRSLTAKYPDFGGVDGWEYFNSEPGGTAAPWEWAGDVSSALNS
jgi:chitinase